MNSVSLWLPSFICVFNFHHDNLNLVFQALTRGRAAPVKLLREGQRLRGRVQAFCREKKVADASSEDDVWSSCYTPDNGIAVLMYSNPSQEPPENAAFHSGVSTQRMTVPPSQPLAGSHLLLLVFVTKCLSNKGQFINTHLRLLWRFYPSDPACLRLPKFLANITKKSICGL